MAAMNVVDIKQRERQCSQLIELRNKLNAGVLITHILNVKISNQPQDVTYASKLRRKLFLKLSNKVFTRRIAHNGREREVEILWEVPGQNLQSSAYYYTSAFFWSDIAVALHTKVLLSEICNEIRTSNPHWGNDWSIAYFISKPLEFLNQPIEHGAIDLEEVMDEEEDNEQLEEDEDEE